MWGRVLLVVVIGGVVAALVVGRTVRPPSREPNASAPSDVPLSIPGLRRDAPARVGARAAIVLHVPAEEILLEQNAFEPLPIASLTKLMSAMVVLDRRVDLETEITIAPEEFRIGGKLRIAPGQETITVRDALYAVVTGSANNAALALVRSTGLSEQEFVREMNRKAITLGLETLHFDDPSGLSARNSGTAYDVARLAAVALRDYALIRDAATRAEYSVVTRNTRREHVVKNPNSLFHRFRDRFAASKTGYLDESLYCLVLTRETGEGTLVAVTLGHSGKQGIEDETLALLDDAEGRVAAASRVR